MAVELRLSPEAENDIAEAYAWYEDRRIGLGEEFLTSLDACIQKVLRQPELHTVVYETYRRSLIRRFPFAVVYEYADSAVTVFAVFHTSRDQNKWKRRTL